MYHYMMIAGRRGLHVNMRSPKVWDPPPTPGRGALVTLTTISFLFAQHKKANTPHPPKIIKANIRKNIQTNVGHKKISDVHKVNVRLSTHVYVYVRKRTYTYVYLRLSTHAYVYARNVRIRTHTYVNVRVRTYTYVYARLSTRTCVYVRMRT